jgi:Fe-Mn family superoxide dismutase
LPTLQKTVNSIAIPLGGHTLPPLRYGYNALEPVIDAETLQIHHEKHHKKYVDELNKAELALAAIRHAEDYSHLNCVKCLEEAIAFNGSGHILHSVYWTIMTAPDTGGNPGTNTKSFIDWYFGSVNAFKAQFAAAAKTVEGSGWGILAYNPAFGRLEILQSEKHQNLTQWGAIPILVCDVWEHAYYLKYKNGRDSYVDAWWRLVDWNEVEHRLVLAARGYLPLA